jgi:hypothetical protein
MIDNGLDTKYAFENKLTKNRGGSYEDETRNSNN